MAKRPKKTKIIKNPDTKGLPRKTFEYLYPEQETIRVPTRPTLPKKGKKGKPPKGRDPRTPTNRKLIMQKKIKKRKDGGMAYQLYGGSTKNFSDGNKFIQSFYDKGGK